MLSLCEQGQVPCEGIYMHLQFWKLVAFICKGQGLKKSIEHDIQKTLHEIFKGKLENIFIHFKVTNRDGSWSFSNLIWKIRLSMNK